MKLGLNVAVSSVMPDYGGSGVVRFPLWLGQEGQSIIRFSALISAGITPILVLDRRSFTDWGWNNKSYLGSLKRWQTLFHNPPIIEAGNEPDGSGSSSSSMAKADWFNMIKAAAEVWPNSLIVSGGLVGIDFSYLDGIDALPIAAVGFHPYSQDETSVVPLIIEIRKHTTSDLWATEFGWTYVADEEHGRATWLSSFIVALWQQGVKVGCVYCGKQDQGPEGLILDDNTPTESWAAYTGAVPAVAGDPPAPPTPDANVVWIGSPNYWVGRSGQATVAIVLHTMDGTLAGCDSWFSQSGSQVSAHYGVGLDGSIHQYVDLMNSAWANGILEPGNTWPYSNGVNPNDMTVSIETEDDGDGSTPVSDAEYASVLATCQIIMAQCPDIEYVVGHNVISPQSRANCPGDRWTASGRFDQLIAALGIKGMA